MSPRAISSLILRVAQTTNLDNPPSSQFTSATPLEQIVYDFSIGNYNPYYAFMPGKRYATMLQMLQYPFSKGSIHIPPCSHERPTTVDYEPAIDLIYHEDGIGNADFEVIVAAQKFEVKIYETEPLSKVTIHRVSPPLS